MERFLEKSRVDLTDTIILAPDLSMYISQKVYKRKYITKGEKHQENLNVF